MDLQKLKRFFTVVECMSITKAAESLYISQPTLSKYISSLEDELGIKLFVRENQTLILTDAGRMLYDQGKLLTEQADTMMARLALADSSERSRLSVVLERFHSDTMFHMLRSLYENDKGFEFTSRTITNNFNEITSMVSSGSVDMGVVCCLSTAEFEKDFSVIRIFKDRIVLIVSEDHKLAGRKSVKLEELAGEDIVYPDCSDNMSEIYRRLCTKVGQEPSRMRFLDQEDQKSRVKWNFSISFCSKYGVGSDLPECFKQIEIEGEDTEFSVALIWRKDDANPCISEFISAMDTYFPDYEWIE